MAFANLRRLATAIWHTIMGHINKPKPLINCPSIRPTDSVQRLSLVIETEDSFIVVGAELPEEMLDALAWKYGCLDIPPTQEEAFFLNVNWLEYCFNYLHIEEDYAAF